MTVNFWKDKRVLVTGHTGFKGSWLSLWLQEKGVNVIGYSLPPPTRPSLFEVAGISDGARAVPETLAEANCAGVGLAGADEERR